jgi:hypothetical protein
MSSIGDRAWAFLTKSDEARSWSANRGYDDAIGMYYSYDTNVAHSRQIRVGDIVVVREDDDVAGWGIIEHIDVVPNQPKEITRCPACLQTRYHSRVTKSPANKCDTRGCGHEFADIDAIRQLETVTAFRAYYASTWTEAARPLHFRELMEFQLGRGTFNAIRPLDTALVPALLDRLSGRDVSLSGDFPRDEVERILGGHTDAIVRRRRGQRSFRFAMMRRFGERCAFSGTQPPQVLEAAHLYSFALRSEHRIDGGLLLRRDYHALFDAKLVTVNPETLRVETAPRLQRFASYRALEGSPLQIQPETQPSLELLAEHYEQAVRVFAHN